jgi:hypothetical protein
MDTAIVAMVSPIIILERDFLQTNACELILSALRACQNVQGRVIQQTGFPPKMRRKPPGQSEFFSDFCG